MYEEEFEIEDIYLKMMMNNDDHVGPINLGNPVEVTILDTAKEIIKLVKG